MRFSLKSLARCDCGGFCGLHSGRCRTQASDFEGFTVGEAGVLCPECAAQADKPFRILTVVVTISESNFYGRWGGALPFDPATFREAAAEVLHGAAREIAGLPDEGFAPAPPIPFDAGVEQAFVVDTELSANVRDVSFGRPRALDIFWSAVVQKGLQLAASRHVRWIGIAMLTLALCSGGATWVALSGGMLGLTSAEVLTAKAWLDAGSSLAALPLVLYVVLSSALSAYRMRRL